MNTINMVNFFFLMCYDRERICLITCLFALPDKKLKWRSMFWIRVQLWKNTVFRTLNKIKIYNILKYMILIVDYTNFYILIDNLYKHFVIFIYRYTKRVFFFNDYKEKRYISVLHIIYYVAGLIHHIYI